MDFLNFFGLLVNIVSLVALGVGIAKWLEFENKKRLLAEPVKVFIGYLSPSTGKTLFEFRLRSRLEEKGGKQANIRLPRNLVASSDGLVARLRNMYPSLVGVDLSFITRQGERFAEIAHGGAELHLVVADLRVFKTVFEACFDDYRQECLDSVINSLAEKKKPDSRLQLSLRRSSEEIVSIIEAELLGAVIAKD